MKVLDIFSGIGGFSLGLERAGFQTVAFCEIDPFCRKVLEKHWPDVPIHEDVTKLRGGDVGAVDLICGGFPCQPFSVAGQRQGTEDSRHLWPEFARLIGESRPRWVLAENVPGLLSGGSGAWFGALLRDLAALRYNVEWHCISAASVGAPHIRDRVWIIANTDKSRLAIGESIGGNACQKLTTFERSCRSDVADDPQHGRRQGRARRSDTGGQGAREKAFQDVADATSEGWRQSRRSSETILEPGAIKRFAGCNSGIGQQWQSEPELGRVAYGVPRRVDRLRSLGNAVVPQVVEVVGRAILEAEALRDAA